MKQTIRDHARARRSASGDFAQMLEERKVRRIAEKLAEFEKREYIALAQRCLAEKHRAEVIQLACKLADEPETRQRVEEAFKLSLQGDITV